MKRHIIRISLVMLLGVVTSVAIAWACALLLDNAPQNLVLEDSTGWVGDVPATWPEARWVSRLPVYGGIVVMRQSEAGLHRQHVAGFGWPVRAWEWELRGANDAINMSAALEVVDDRPLPLRPLLPGLLANTAIYGSVWWAMLFGPGLVIRWRRRRAGRCAKCGYDLRGLSPAPGSASGRGSDSVCPECGAER